MEEAKVESIHDLYNLMINNKNLSGTFIIEEEVIHWNLFEGFTIIICKDPIDYYIGIERKLFGKLTDSFTHWHPSAEDVYSNVCEIGTKGNVTVVFKSLLIETLLYSGPKIGCKYTRKWFFGRYYYLNAE